VGVLREYEIEPEPEPAMAAAIVHAFERLAREEGWDDGPGEASTAWRSAAAREAIADGSD
jgi:hypothetical protein